MPFNNYRTGINSQYRTPRWVSSSSPSGGCFRAGRRVCLLALQWQQPHRCDRAALHVSTTQPAPGTATGSSIRNGRTARAAKSAARKAPGIRSGRNLDIVEHAEPDHWLGHRHLRDARQPRNRLRRRQGQAARAVHRLPRMGLRLRLRQCQFNAFGYPQASPFEGNYCIRTTARRVLSIRWAQPTWSKSAIRKPAERAAARG